MSLSPLLNSETISIDNHGRGVPINIDDRAVHLHKRFNERSSKNGNAEVRIPLNGGEIEVVMKHGKNSDSIISELKRAFKNPRKRRNFVKSLHRGLVKLAVCSGELYRSSEDTQALNEDGMKRVDEIIRNVASLFGVDDYDKKEVLYLIQSKVVYHYVSMRNTKHSGILHRNLIQDALVYRGMETHLYVQADLREQSFTLTRARYMLE
jgi:hypothetical protein